MSILYNRRSFSLTVATGCIAPKLVGAQDRTCNDVKVHFVSLPGSYGEELYAGVAKAVEVSPPLVCQIGTFLAVYEDLLQLDFLLRQYNSVNELPVVVGSFGYRYSRILADSYPNIIFVEIALSPQIRRASPGNLVVVPISGVAEVSAKLNWSVNVFIGFLTTVVFTEWARYVIDNPGQFSSNIVSSEFFSVPFQIQAGDLDIKMNMDQRYGRFEPIL